MILVQVKPKRYISARTPDFLPACRYLPELWGAEQWLWTDEIIGICLLLCVATLPGLHLLHEPCQHLDQNFWLEMLEQHPGKGVVGNTGSLGWNLISVDKGLQQRSYLVGVRKVTTGS